MGTPLQTATRLLAALDDLLTQQTMVIRTMDFAEAAALQERASPLVDRLCELAADPAVQRLRPQVRGLLDRYDQNHQFLGEQILRVQQELQGLNQARGRLRRVAPAYTGGATPAESSRLNAAA